MERVRFLEPVPADTTLVLQVTIASVEPKGEGRFLVRCSNAAFKADSRERPGHGRRVAGAGVRMSTPAAPARAVAPWQARAR